MSSSQLLDAIKQAQSRALASEYSGKLNNQFVAELKGSLLFHFDGSELCLTASTALSLMGTCWIAAAQRKADETSLEAFMPSAGLKHLMTRQAPTLRSCLVDLCSNGGQTAFITASANLDKLSVYSQRICTERIERIFKTLVACDRDPYAFEDFKNGIEDLSEQAKQCAATATETREAFSKWGRIATELHAILEKQQGVAGGDGGSTSSQQQMAKFNAQPANGTKAQIDQAAKSLSDIEQRLNQDIAAVPSSWESVVSGAASGFAQAVPGIVSAAVLAATARGDGEPSSSGVSMTDPAYATATSVRDLVNQLYEYLGGDKGAVDWSKFADDKDFTYISTMLTGYKNIAAGRDAPATQKLREALDKLLAVTDKIRQLKDNKSVPDSELQQWKDSVRAGRADILTLTATTNSFASNAVPTSFIRAAPSQGAATANASANTALQGVRISQTAVEVAQSNYDAALVRHVKTADAMSAINTKLAKINAEGQTLDKIRDILADHISVLVDLNTQLGKFESFFTMLANVVDSILRSHAEALGKGRGEQQGPANGAIKTTDIIKQTVYTLLLHMKAYYSLLRDVSEMYIKVDRQYLVPGTDLCMKLSRGAGSNDPMESLQRELNRFTEESAKRVAEFVKEKQDAVLRGLKDRAKNAAEITSMIDEVVSRNGLTVDQSAIQAIQAGGELAKQIAQQIITTTSS